MVIESIHRIFEYSFSVHLFPFRILVLALEHNDAIHMYIVHMYVHAYILMKTYFYARALTYVNIRETRNFDFKSRD